MLPFNNHFVMFNVINWVIVILLSYTINWVMNHRITRLHCIIVCCVTFIIQTCPCYIRKYGWKKIKPYGDQLKYHCIKQAVWAELANCAVIWSSAQNLSDLKVVRAILWGFSHIEIFFFGCSLRSRNPGHFNFFQNSPGRKFCDPKRGHVGEKEDVW